jgi:hypothetical protein
MILNRKHLDLIKNKILIMKVANSLILLIIKREALMK